MLEELDLDALLQRRPTIVLVDELAHTNAPGSRNPKRYQDVEEILRAGINVITTLNIQHLESLHDIVERATGVRVKERLPDYVVSLADQIVNVDLSAEDLRERLQQGKIYPPERVETALENFFTPEKLTQLRELAMEEIAFRLDRARRDDENRGGQPTAGSERVMVCLSSRSPHAAALLRKAARMADRLGAPWYAVYVQTPREAPEQIDAATSYVTPLPPLDSSSCSGRRRGSRRGSSSGRSNRARRFRAARVPSPPPSGSSRRRTPPRARRGARRRAAASAAAPAHPDCRPPRRNR